MKLESLTNFGDLTVWTVRLLLGYQQDMFGSLGGILSIMKEYEKPFLLIYYWQVSNAPSGC